MSDYSRRLPIIDFEIFATDPQGTELHLFPNMDGLINVWREFEESRDRVPRAVQQCPMINP